MMATAPPPSDQHHQSSLRRRRRLNLRYIDRNRPLQILAILLLYLLAIHLIFKFAAFNLPSHSNGLKDGDTGIRGGRRLSSSVLSHGGFGGVGVVAFSDSNISAHRHHRRCAEIVSPLKSQKDDKTPEENVATTEIKNCRHKRQRIPVLSYKDNYVIVSKPAGMTMHRNSNSWGRSKQPVLETTIKKQLSRKPFLVHRLDHRTSGALLLAFNSETAGDLHGRLKADDSTKLYVALVRGDLREKFMSAAAGGSNIDLSANGGGGVIGSSVQIPNVVDDVSNSSDNDVATGLDASEYTSKITVDLPIKIDGIEKEAQTEFYFLSSMNLDDETEDTDGPYVTKSLSLLLCQPKTGRTHQIRRHAIRALQSPIIGDSEHGDSRVNRFWRERVGFNRLGLHCLYLHLPSSSDNDDDIKCIAPLTDDFKDSLEHDELETLWKEAVKRMPPLLLEPYDDRGGTFGRNYRRGKS
mmetsp:Transcript_22538/g.36831  ORF Transcript_22538/g.36831 Transcript_22538/m.36831 type:complete len:466 (+) Transcript_22538:34-1431(+)